jgi:S-DNA-T family DNA segregation ATPase FtsK/SpoIIIE
VRKAPADRQLPANVSYADIPTGESGRLPIGIAESNLKPVGIDFAGGGHFLLFGASECGKSTFLRGLANRIVDRYTPDEARVVIIDYRRSLLGAVATPHQIGYGSSAKVTASIAAEVAGVMRQRLPGPDITPAQLRERSWWKGPELFVLIDDYELVSAAPQNPLLPLLEYVPQGRDVGLHIVLARRSGGAARAMYEQFVMQLRELDSPGIVMSGNREEGKILGDVRASEMPPGRGWLVIPRKSTQLIQVANLAPEDTQSEKEST